MRQLYTLYCITLLGFLLGIYEGKIALWSGDDPLPCKVFPYSAELLPPADQARLREGVRIDTQEELISRMEDYLS